MLARTANGEAFCSVNAALAEPHYDEIPGSKSQRAEEALSFEFPSLFAPWAFVVRSSRPIERRQGV